jgi:hypothetical protein
VKSSFEEFIETNLMVQSEFNLIFWFVSYNIFLLQRNSGARALSPLSRSLTHAGSGGSLPPLNIADDGPSACVADGLANTGAEEFPVPASSRKFYRIRVQIVLWRETRGAECGRGVVTVTVAVTLRNRVVLPSCCSKQLS